MTSAPAQDEQQYRTVAQLADHLNVSKWTIYRRYKEWPHSEIGGIRFSAEHVAAIEARIQKVAPAPDEVTPKYTAAELAHARRRLGLPTPRSGS